MPAAQRARCDHQAVPLVQSYSETDTSWLFPNLLCFATLFYLEEFPATKQSVTPSDPSTAHGSGLGAPSARARPVGVPQQRACRMCGPAAPQAAARALSRPRSARRRRAAGSARAPRPVAGLTRQRRRNAPGPSVRRRRRRRRRPGRGRGEAGGGRAGAAPRVPPAAGWGRRGF